MIKIVKGLILKSIKYSESDKLVTALTEEGILFFKARGIRSITSKNAAGCAPFVYSELILEARGEKCFLRKAVPLYSTIKAGASLNSLALASYLVSLAEDTARDAETGTMVLRLLMNALYLISKEDRSEDLIKAVFEMRLLAANGLMPRLEGCSVCGKSADRSPFFFFRLTEGDLVCPDCITSFDTGLYRVSAQVIALCRHSVEKGEESAYALCVPKDLLRDFARFSERYLLNQMERNYQTLDFYHRVKRMPEAGAAEKNESGSDEVIVEEKENETL